MDLPSTSLSLIRQARQRDDAAWIRLTKVYAPLVYRQCRRRGLQASDASDVVQDVFQAVSKNIDQFDRSGPNASFCRWIYGIAGHKINDHFRRQKVRREIDIGCVLEETLPAVSPALPSDSSSTDSSRPNESVRPAHDPTRSSDDAPVTNDRRLIAQRMMRAIRDDYSDLHWKSFYRTVIDQQPPNRVAEELHIKAATVRQIKCRILRRLRAELTELGELD